MDITPELNASELTRRPDESPAEHHRRLVLGRLEDRTLAGWDFAELAPELYGKPYSSDVARRMMYGSAATLQILDAEANKRAAQTDAEQSAELDAKLATLAKERQKFYDQRNAYNGLLRQRARQEEINAILRDALARGVMTPLTLSAPPPQSTGAQTGLLVSLNDIHYGAKVNNHWRRYDANICRQMFAEYVEQIREVQCTHHVDRCLVWANGDLINGNIHYRVAVSNMENVIDQVVGVSELVSHFLAELGTMFAEVQFVLVAGNHSRIAPKEVALKDERLELLIPWYLEARLQNMPNVRIGGARQLDTTVYLVDWCGKTYCGVHGDFDGTAAKVNALQQMVGQRVYAVLSGHLHENQIREPQGVKMIKAGSFLGMDDFCVEHRIVGRPQQLICVCDPSGVRCIYDVNFSRTTGANPPGKGEGTDAT